MEVTLISQGFDLMLFGMGTVFGFLTLLVGVTHLMSSSVNRIVSPAAGGVEINKSAAAAVSMDPELVSVIQLAIDKHRGR
jgi:oxaloacetate decarboxylase gamma subunit